jgi:hypothetical protein
MKLLKRVQNAERDEAAFGVVIPSLVWSQDERNLGEGVFLNPDQHVATDVFLRSEAEADAVVFGGAPAGEEPPIPECPVWRTVERISNDPADLGQVYGADGELVGRVTAVNGPLFDIRYHSAAGG